MMTIIPLIGNDYGPAGAWCWVQSETTAGKVKPLRPSNPEYHCAAIGNKFSGS